MRKIRLLDKITIAQIAAGEAVERPSNVVKELVENAIDAGAGRISCEIKNGGISYLRITDDGSGIDPDDIRNAFMRHATSKIRDAADLERIGSLGFRGEALASISAVARVELISKVSDELSAKRYVIEGGEEKSFEDIGAPDGTTIIVRDLFYNVPARHKFLKTPMTEGSKIGAFMEMLSLSRPDIAFQFTVNGSVKFHTSGNGELKDVIYNIYGKDIAGELIPVQNEYKGINLSGYIAKPSVFRKSRNLEIYFVNGRFIKSKLISKAIEDGYSLKMMNHNYPYTCLMIDVDPELVDVNVHPAKMEIRFFDEKSVYDLIVSTVANALKEKDMTVDAKIGKEVSVKTEVFQAEPFEKDLIKEIAPEIEKKPEYVKEYDNYTFLAEEARPYIKIIGQVFDTYWIVEYDNRFMIIDQHAAHEKVLFEKLKKEYAGSGILTQSLDPAAVFTLGSEELYKVKTYKEAFEKLGFELEEFGEREYRLNTVPYNLSKADPKELFFDILDSVEEGKEVRDLDTYVDKIASEACKAAVKGGGRISALEAERLIDELMKLDDPYHCPHGRPTVIAFSKSELEKKFGRIV